MSEQYPGYGRTKGIQPDCDGLGQWGNRLDQLGEVNLIGRFWQSAEVTAQGETIEFMQFGDSRLKPFVILNSAEYPGLPPEAFCQRMQDAGYFTLAVQRPGFGASTPAPTMAGQVRVLESFLARTGLSDIVLMAMGTGVPVGGRLALRNEDIGFTFLTNPTFNNDPLDELRPDWFARLVRQAMTSPAMARAALEWIKGNARLFGHGQLFEKWYSKHAGDREFLADNLPEFDEVAAALLNIDVDTFRNEIMMSIEHDPFLQDGRFAGQNMLAVSGAETTASWKRGFESETDRLGVKRVYLPSGDTFAPFLYPDTLVDLIETHRGQSGRTGSRLTAGA